MKRLVLALILACASPESAPPKKASPSPQAKDTAQVSSIFPLARLTPTPAKAKAYLIRWWTDTCPYCEASLPAIESLRTSFEKDGLVTIAVYHPKPPREVSIKEIERFAKERGYLGALAVDLDWSLLNDVWLSTRERSATSVSFLVDEGGVIRFVHPGPEFHASTDEAHKECNEDFLRLTKEIELLLH